MIRQSALIVAATLCCVGPAPAQDSSSGSGDSSFGRDDNGAEQCYCRSPIPSDCVVPSHYPACMGVRPQQAAPAQVSVPLQAPALAPKQAAPPSCAEAVAIGYQGTFCNVNGTLVPIGQVYNKQTSAVSAPATPTPPSVGVARPQAVGRVPTPGTAPTLTLPPSGSSQSGGPLGGLVDFSQPSFAPLNGDQKSFVDRMKAQAAPPSAPPAKPDPDGASGDGDSQ